MKINKPGPGNVDFIDKLTLRDLVDDFLRDIPRLSALRFRKTHRDVGCEVTVPRVACPLYRRFDRGDVRCLSEIRQAGNGLLYKLCNAGFQRNEAGRLECGDGPRDGPQWGPSRGPSPLRILNGTLKKLNRIDVDRPPDTPGSFATFQ